MPFLFHRHHLKRLNHSNENDRFSKHLSIDSNFQSSKYKKYFDFPLNELLVDHSTDPQQNTSMFSFDDADNQGRFANHQMIIRQEKGETKLLRPKSDPVLIKGFTKKIQHSSDVVRQNSPTSIMKKMKKTQKFYRRRCPKSSFKTSSIENYRNDIDERQSMEFDRTSFFDDIHQRSRETFCPPLPLMNVIPRFPPAQFSSPTIEEHFYRISPVQLYSEYSFDYRRSSIDPMFHFNRPFDPFLFDNVSDRPSRFFPSNSIHRSDYSF